MKYLISLDLDGTLLDDNKSISTKTVYILNYCKKIGCIIVINTTRNFNRTKKYIEIIKPNFVICLDGAYVVNDKNIVLQNNPIPHKRVKEIISILKNIDGIKLVCSEKLDNEMVLDENFAKQHNKNFSNITEIENNLSYKLIYTFNDITKIDVPKILKDEKFIVSIKHHYFRIMQNIDKWDGLKVVLSNLNYKDIFIISFGNDIQDYNTLKNSTIGFAMKNSQADLLSKIKDITLEDNNHDGVAIQLSKIFIGSKL